MVDTLAASERESRQKTGNYLLALAWAVEIIAASIGLFFAITRLLLAQEAMPDASPLLVLVNSANQALPWVAVAIVELTKIPFATAFYRAPTKVWKGIFLGGLLILLVITFETFFTGFERSWFVLNRDISVSVNELKRLRDVINSQEEIVKDNKGQLIDTGNIDEKLAQILKGIEQQRKKAVAAIQDEIDDLEESTDDRLKPLRDQLQFEKEKLEGFRKDRDKEVDGRNAALREGLGLIRRNWGEITAAAQKKLDDLNIREEKAYDRYKTDKQQTIADFEPEIEGCFFSCDAVEARKSKALDRLEESYNASVAKIESERANVNLGGGASQTEAIRNARAKADQDIRGIKDRYDGKIDAQAGIVNQLQAKITATRTNTDPQVQAEINDLKQDIGDENAAARQKKADAEKRNKSLQDNVIEQGITIFSSQKEIDAARSEEADTCQALEEKILDNQIYRLAKLLGGQDIACDENFFPILRATFIIWFGSIAVIISGTGTLLAFGGLVLKDPRDKPPGRGPVKSAFRLTLLAIRRRLNKPRTIVKKVEKEVQKIVEVVKEVPVDKVVFKEIPIEAVRKEVVHIPVYTNDPSLLGKDFDPQDEQ